MTQSLTDDQDGFARRLGTFGARPVSLDREALLFAAGQACTERAKETPRPVRGYRIWQASTVAMTLLSVVLGSLLMRKPAPEQQIVYVERQIPAVEPATISPPESQISRSPQVSVDQPIEITPRLDSVDARLAEAWKTRQEMIAVSGQAERLLATTSRRGEGRSVEQPLTRSSLLGDQSQDTIQRWLKEQL